MKPAIQTQTRKEKERTMENTQESSESKRPGRPPKITPKVLDRAVQMYNAGHSPAKICKQVWCNVTHATLYNHLRKDPRVQMRRVGRRGLSDEQVAYLVDQLAEGRTLSSIREDAEMKPSGRNKRFALQTLSRAAKAAGAEVRGPGRPPSPESEDEDEEVSGEGVEE